MIWLYLVSVVLSLELLYEDTSSPKLTEIFVMVLLAPLVAVFAVAIWYTRLKRVIKSYGVKDDGRRIIVGKSESSGRD